jgi:hypothetical protein
MKTGYIIVEKERSLQKEIMMGKKVNKKTLPVLVPVTGEKI